MQIIPNIDPIVVLAYDREYAVTRASQSDTFEVNVGGTRFYRSVAEALKGCAGRHVSADLSHTTGAAIRAAGCVPVAWHDGPAHAETGWVEV